MLDVLPVLTFESSWMGSTNAMGIDTKGKRIRKSFINDRVTHLVPNTRLPPIDSLWSMIPALIRITWCSPGVVLARASSPGIWHYLANYKVWMYREVQSHIRESFGLSNTEMNLIRDADDESDDGWELAEQQLIQSSHLVIKKKEKEIKDKQCNRTNGLACRR